MPAYSHSRLSAFEVCPLSYKLRYIDQIKLEEEEEGIEAYLGSRVHDSLEKLYRDQLHGKHNTLDEILGHYSESWEKNFHENIRIVKKQYTAQNYKDTGTQCLRDYYIHYTPFNQSKTLALEKKITIEIQGYTFTGYIDRLSHQTTGHYEIHDYKTAKYLPSQKGFDDDRQLPLYQLGVQNLWNDVEAVDLVYHYLIYDKEIRSKRTVQQLAELEEKIISLINDIETAEAEDNFPANQTGLCNWCSYTTICPATAHLAKTKELSLNEFLCEPGVNLVDRYAELNQKKKEVTNEIDNKLEKLREALIKYAEAENVNTIRGSRSKIRITRGSRMKLPGKNDDGREELEDIIKQCGLWMNASDLNVNSLLRVLEDEKLDPEIHSKIKEFISYEINTRVSLSKLRDSER